MRKDGRCSERFGMTSDVCLPPSAIVLEVRWGFTSAVVDQCAKAAGSTLSWGGEGRPEVRESESRLVIDQAALAITWLE